jgi:hypothetical protein
MLLSTPWSFKWSLSPRFPHQNPVYTSILPIHATFPAHHILLDLITRTISGTLPLNLTSGPGFATLYTVSILPIAAVLFILVILYSFSMQQGTDDFGTESTAPAMMSLRQGRHCKCCYVGAWRGK